MQQKPDESVDSDRPGAVRFPCIEGCCPVRTIIPRFRKQSYSLAEYVSALAADQTGLSKSDGARIALLIGEGEIYLPIQTALPCGMIVAELLTNAFKHAFLGDRTGTVAIGFARDGDTISISVSDDGPGMPEGFDPQDTDSFGWQLIVNLAAQIGGSVHVSGPGTRVTLTIPQAQGSMP